MDKKLIKIAARAAFNVYIRNISIKSTDFDLVGTWYKGRPLQVVVFAGSNSKMDWFWNLWLWSSDGVKRSAVVSAKRVYESDQYKTWRKPEFPLAIFGHSKSGPTVLRWKQKYGADYCVAFCPAPGFRRPVPKLENTLIVTDKDDLVPFMGGISFGQPECERIELKKDISWWDITGRISNHSMKHIKEWADAL